MIFCIHCALKAMVENRQVPSFDETEEQHMRRCHPDLAATSRERTELEKIMAERMTNRGGGDDRQQDNH